MEVPTHAGASRGALPHGAPWREAPRARRRRCPPCGRRPAGGGR